MVKSCNSSISAYFFVITKVPLPHFELYFNVRDADLFSNY